MEEYIQDGGYELYSQIKTGKIKKESVVEELKNSNLRGLGLSLIHI